MRAASLIADAPDSPLCMAVDLFAREVYRQTLYHHTQRTFRFACEIGRESPRPFDPEVLYISCVLHDLGLVEGTPVFGDFEIDGANAAREFLERRGMSAKKVDLVWHAIALHTTPGIARDRPAEVALVQAGAAVDVGIIPLSRIPKPFLDAVLEHFPRLNFKEAMVEILKERIRRTPRTIKGTKGTSVSELSGLHLPCTRHWLLCDVVRRSSFSE